MPDETVKITGTIKDDHGHAGIRHVELNLNLRDLFAAFSRAPSDIEQRLREALEEIERLKQHIADLNHDFESAIKHCNEHHTEAA
jgi:uncharacterized membrane protein YccC